MGKGLSLYIQSLVVSLVNREFLEMLSEHSVGEQAHRSAFMLNTFVSKGRSAYLECVVLVDLFNIEVSTLEVKLSGHLGGQVVELRKVGCHQLKLIIMLTT